MAGFLVSLIFLLLASYIGVSILRPKSFLVGFIYFILICFAQIVGIAEFLSLFKIFTPLSFLLLQCIILLLTVILWIKKGKPLFKKLPIQTFISIFKSIKKDKLLLIMGVGFVFFIITTVFLCCVTGITSGDGMIYHVARSFYWVKNASINHFETSQVRMLAFPINSEILYAWVIMFLKKPIGLAFFSFIGYILAVCGLFGLMNNYSITRRLWVIFLCSSYSSILVQPSGTETDVIIAGLIISSMYLFLQGLKYNTNKYFYFSALSYALAIGTKTTAFFLIPAVALFMLYHSYQIYGKKAFQPLLKFIGFGCLNFILFGIYNYILNFNSFGNFLGAINTIDLHKNSYGIRGMIANLIKNITLFFDFTGFTWNEKLAEFVIPAKEMTLSVLGLSGIPDGINSTESNVLNNSLYEPMMGWGLVGFLTFIPASLYSLIRSFFSKSKIAKTNLLYALMFFMTLLVMSYSIVFMTYNNRFISSFVLVCAPLLGCLYCKQERFFKSIIVLIALFYLILVSTHIWSRPATKIFNALFVKHYTIEQIQNRRNWSLYKKNIDLPSIEKDLIEKIKKYPKTTRFVIFNSNSLRTAEFYNLIFEGYHIDFKLWETIDLNELENYDVLINTVNGQYSNIAYKFKDNINNYYIKNGQIEHLPQDVQCIYMSINEVLTSSEGRPVQVVCDITPEYLQSKNYRIIDKEIFLGKLRFIFITNKRWKNN